MPWHEGNTRPVALADLGDDWFSAAEKAKSKDKADLQQGARYVYTLALPSLSGLVKTKIEKRLKDLASATTIPSSAVLVASS